MAIADLETSKKQARNTWLNLATFVQREYPTETQETNLPMIIAHWLTDLWRKEEKIKRVSTLLQKARILQGLMPGKLILGSKILKDYFKGWGRLQEFRPQGLELASQDQASDLRRRATTPLLKLAALFLTRAAARLSDLRVWIGGGGQATLEGKKLSLSLRKRKTDQSGGAPMEHIIGPLVISKKEESCLRMASVEIWTKRPLQGSDYANAKEFLQELQKLKREVGVRSMIAFRRGRAKEAARVVSTKDVGALLGHKPNSSSTRRYTRQLDVREEKKRLIMTKERK